MRRQVRTSSSRSISPESAPLLDKQPCFEDRLGWGRHLSLSAISSGLYRLAVCCMQVLLPWLYTKGTKGTSGVFISNSKYSSVTPRSRHSMTELTAGRKTDKAPKDIIIMTVYTHTVPIFRSKDLSLPALFSHSPLFSLF